MSKEAIDLLEEIWKYDLEGGRCPVCKFIVCTDNCRLNQALAILKKPKNQQPSSGQWTENMRDQCKAHHRGLSIYGKAKSGDYLAKKLIEACDRLDRAAQQRKDLLEALERDAFLANQAISATPTGDLRNKLTEINILRLAAIAKAEKEG